MTIIPIDDEFLLRGAAAVPFDVVVVVVVVVAAFSQDITGWGGRKHTSRTTTE